MEERLICGIPTLCRNEALRAQLRALLGGTLVPDRTIVIDNGRSFEFDDARVTVARPPFNVGVALSWNYVLRYAAERRALAIIANDDLTLEPDSVARLVEVFRDRTEDVRVVGGHPTEPWSFFIVDAAEYLARIGEFDAIFYPAYYEDNCAAYRLRLAGDRMDLAETGIEHVSHGTEKSMGDAERVRLRARYDVSTRLYQSKWGGQPPRGELYYRPYDPSELRGTK